MNSLVRQAGWLPPIRRVFVCASALLTASCPQNPLDVYNYEGNSSVVEDAAPLHIFLIGLDGWGSFSLPRAEMPVIKRMMENGAYTLAAKAVMPSRSAPNWVSMLSGVPPALHGYTQNTAKPLFTPAITDEDGRYPNVITLLSKLRPDCAIGVFYEWEGIGDIFPVCRAAVEAQLPDLSSNRETLEPILNYIDGLRASLSFTFVHFDGADHAGHSAGYGSDAYYDMLRGLDGFVGEIEQAVRDAGLMDNAVFIISADHGGKGNDHGADTIEEREIPLILYGKNIKSGTVIPGPVDIYDIAPSIAALFGISPPTVWTGNRLPLQNP
ncbi:MAG: alkaline phosphatase [Treponema sp.]|jgi:predicted AlkP superfamily pyrophosphatase or phosphodiesterase|nr:alkaline phosphatase [Treponema sp.]